MKNGLSRAVLRLVPLLLVFLVTSPAAAQYRAAGSGLDLRINEQEYFESQIDNARWHWGAFYVDPALAIGDLRYRDNVVDTEGNETSDVTGSVHAGLKAYLPMREKAVVAAHAIPGYRFWVDLTERNDVVGNYGLGVFGFQNRLEYELSAKTDRDQRFPTSELLQQVNETRDRFRGTAQIRIAGAFALALGGQLDKLEYGLPGDLSDEDAENLGLLDREETRYRLGLRYLLRGSDGWIGLGAERAENDFQEATEERSNEGDNFFLELRLRGNKIGIDADLVQNDLQPTADGIFPGFDGTTGSLLVEFRPTSRIVPKLYWRSDLQYSVIAALTAFLEMRVGAALEWNVGNRSVVEGFYEEGDNDYTETGGLLVEDVQAFGAVYSFRMLEQGVVRLGYRETRYDSGTVGDRQFSEVIASFSFGQIGTW